MRNPALRHLLFGSVLTVGATTAVAHAHHDGGLEPLPISSATTYASGAGVIAKIDPVTGQLIEPDIGRIQSTANVLPASDYSKVHIETKADGSVVVNMNGQRMSRSFARMNADGSYEEHCSERSDAPTDAAATTGGHP